MTNEVAVKLLSERIVSLENEKSRIKDDLKWVADQYRSLAQYLDYCVEVEESHGVSCSRKFSTSIQISESALCHSEKKSTIAFLAENLSREIFRKIIACDPSESRYVMEPIFEIPTKEQVERWRRILGNDCRNDT